MTMLRHLRHWFSGDMPNDCPKCIKLVEPWMFGVTLTLISDDGTEGPPIPATVHRPTAIGRARMAARRAAGRPERQILPLADE